jgi:hypothetical protein
MASDVEAHPSPVPEEAEGDGHDEDDTGHAHVQEHEDSERMQRDVHADELSRADIPPTPPILGPRLSSTGALSGSQAVALFRLFDPDNTGGVSYRMVSRR